MSSFYSYEPTATLISELRIRAAEQIDDIDGGEECENRDSRLTSLADLMESAADRLQAMSNADAERRSIAKPLLDTGLAEARAMNAVLDVVLGKP